MHLSEAEILKAANIAASKYFSMDVAIGRSDLVSIAVVRILERNPDCIAMAVQSGREGLARVIGTERYQKETNGRTTKAVGGFVNAEKLNHVHQQLNRRGKVETKKREFSKKIIRLAGRPIGRFGRLGVVYPAAIESCLVDVYFDPVELVDVGRYRRRLLFKGKRVTKRMRELAGRHYCLLLLER